MRTTAHNSPDPLAMELPFLGLGISSSAAEAVSLAEGRLARRWELMSSLGFLNIGIDGTTIVPTALPDLLDHAALERVVHLTDINLVDELDEERLHNVVESCQLLHPRWLQEDLGVWLWGRTPLVEHMIPPIFDDDSLAVAAANIRHIMDASRLPFLAENPPVHYVLGDIDLLSFMGRISERTGCGLVLDIGHLASYCICTERDPIRYVSEWRQIDRVHELHLSGSETVETRRGWLWYDSHHLPLDLQTLRILDCILERAPSVRAITLEAEGAPSETLWGNVERVRERVEQGADDDDAQ